MINIVAEEGASGIFDAFSSWNWNGVV